MVHFEVYNETNAPESSLGYLESAKRRMGFVTTLNGVMAESPELLAGYNSLSELFFKSTLSREAKHVVLIAASVENNCEYCVAAHSTIGLKSGLDQRSVSSLRSDSALGDAKLEAVRKFTKLIVTNRGWVDEADVDDFVNAGHSRRNVFDVILGVGMKTLSNYTNHIAHTPLDPAWEQQRWTNNALS